MQNSPTAGTDAISKILLLVQEGSRSQRCKISKGTLVFLNPDVQALNVSVSAYKKAPSTALFEAVKQALNQCETKAVSSYRFDEINQLIRSLERETSPRKPSKPPL